MRLSLSLSLKQFGAVGAVIKSKPSLLASFFERSDRFRKFIPAIYSEPMRFLLFQENGSQRVV